MDRDYFERRHHAFTQYLHSAVDLALKTMLKGMIVVYFVVFAAYSVSVGPILRILSKHFGFRPVETELEHSLNEWVDEVGEPISDEIQRNSPRH